MNDRQEDDDDQDRDRDPRSRDGPIDVGRVPEPGPDPREAEQANGRKARRGPRIAATRTRAAKGRTAAPATRPRSVRRRRDEAGEQHALEQLRGRRRGRRSRAERETGPADQPAGNEAGPSPSMSSVRHASPSRTAASTNHGPASPAPEVATPAMKNTAMPTSGIASAAARHAEANFSSVVETRTTGIRLRVRWRIDGIGHEAQKTCAPQQIPRNEARHVGLRLIFIVATAWVRRSPRAERPVQTRRGRPSGTDRWSTLSRRAYQGAKAIRNPYSGADHWGAGHSSSCRPSTRLESGATRPRRPG